MRSTVLQSADALRAAWSPAAPAPTTTTGSEVNTGASVRLLGPASTRPYSQNVRYSVVVCCYNSGALIKELVERASLVLANRGQEYEILLVNDASPDPATWDAIRRLARADPHVRAIDLQFNVGQFRALMCGLEKSQGEVVVTMDDDLQHPPEEIEKLLQTLETDPQLDVVIGRYESKQHSRTRNIGTWLVDLIYRKSYGKPANLKLTSFRALRRDTVDALLAHQTSRPVPGALILQVTNRISNVDVDHHPRREGESGWRFTHLVSATLDNVIAGSLLPLRAVSGLGIVLAALAMLIGLGYLVAFFIGVIRVQGFTTLVLLVTTLGGLTLASIGLVGEYLARVVVEVTRQPLYVIREQID